MPQNDYKHSMNGWSKVITGVKFNCIAAMQGANHVKHLILPMPPSEKRTSQPYEAYEIQTRLPRVYGPTRYQKSTWIAFRISIWVWTHQLVCGRLN